MLRGYRRIILATVGWAFLSGAQPVPKQINGSKHTGQAAPTPQSTATRIPTLSASTATGFTPYPGYNPDPCYQVKDKDAADLCAQWRSAIAAENAVEEAKRATSWSVIATFLNGLGLIAVGFALCLTIQSNRIARDTARRQLRAYISVEPGGVNAAENDKHRAPILLHNSGATPAHEVMVFSRFAIADDPIEFDEEKAKHATLIGGANDASVGPSVERWIYAFFDQSFAKPHLLKIDRKKAAIIHFGYVSYKDAFGDTQETRFAFYHWGEKLTGENAKRCRFGNSAT